MRVILCVYVIVCVFGIMCVCGSVCVCLSVYVFPEVEHTRSLLTHSVDPQKNHDVKKKTFAKPFFI